MKNCKSKKGGQKGGILLLFVFSLLQFAILGPSFIHAFPKQMTPATCQGDHALCGCSPSRIASKTCCCALATISPCCQKNYIKSAEEEKTALGTVITSLPCGGSDDPLVSASIEAYLLPTVKIFNTPLSSTIYPLESLANQLHYNILPPTPPPEV